LTLEISRRTTAFAAKCSSIEVGARLNNPAETTPVTEEDAVPISIDILNRRATRFVLGSPRPKPKLPELVIGRLRAGDPPAIEGIRLIALATVSAVAGLIEVAAADCGPDDGTLHYWFEVDDRRSKFASSVSGRRDRPLRLLRGLTGRCTSSDR